MNKICFGCGAKLQVTDKDNIGYIPQEKFESSNYCQRCFRIMHYGDNLNLDAPKDIKSIINSVNNKANFVLFLTDFVTLNEDIVNLFKQIKKPKILLINKSDIIPKSVVFKHLISSIKDIYNIDDEVNIISAYSAYGINALINYLYYKGVKEVYILGETNAGKSSLINKMMEILNINLNKITTSKHANTTLDFIRLKLSDDLTVIDTPGFVIYEDALKDNSLINPKIYQMKKGETLKINDYYLNFSENTNVVIYMNKSFEINKFFKPISLNEEFKVDNNIDLVIKGKCFINIKNGCTIKTNLNKDGIEIRKSIVGGTNE